MRRLGLREEEGFRGNSRHSYSGPPSAEPPFYRGQEVQRSQPSSRATTPGSDTSHREGGSASSLPREEGSLYSGRGSRNSSFSVLGDTQGVGQLAERLVVRKGEEAMEPLPHSLLRKYIAYARRWVHPALGQEAKKVLQDFYLQLRAKPEGETTPVTTRQLESLIRLTEARARLELREEASQQDAIEVVEIKIGRASCRERV